MADPNLADDAMIGSQLPENADTQIALDSQASLFDDTRSQAHEDADTQLRQDIEVSLAHVEDGLPLEDEESDVEGGASQESVQDPNEDLFNDDGVAETQYTTQDLDTDVNMDLGQDEEQAENDEELLEDDGLDAMKGIERSTQEHGSEIGDVQESQDVQQESRVAGSEVPETPMQDHPVPASQIQANRDDDDPNSDSLFVPFERIGSPSPRPSAGPSTTSPFDQSSATPGSSTRFPTTTGIFNRPFPIHTQFGRSSATPGPAPRPAPSNTLPPPIPASRPAAQLSGSVFRKILNMKKTHNQNMAASSRQAHRSQPVPDGENILNAILTRAPARESSIDISAIDDDDKADRAARAEYHKKKEYYDGLKRKKGRLSFAEDIEWMRIQSAEKVRKEKRKRDLELAAEESVESDPFSNLHGPSNGRDVNDNMDDERLDNDPAGSRRQEASSGSKFTSIRDAELRSMEVALQANVDRPSSKKKRKGASASEEHQDSPSGSSSRKGRGQPKGSKSKSSGPASSSRSGGNRKQTAKEKKAAENALRMGTSLMYSDVFRQQAADDAPEEPTHTSMNKADALKELIASVAPENRKSAKDDSAALLRATKDFDGQGSCKTDGKGMWKIKGMKTSLKHYQILGTAFMRRRERDSHEPRGGLMADQMGLGKTLMMLANIVNGRPKPNAEYKTTLLVASPALLTQWGREIELHTQENLLVFMRYTTGSRIDSNRASDILKQHDIILTTYHEVMKSYPKNDPPIECQTVEQKTAWWKAVYDKYRGPLHRMMFHRIVLDEAQAIKNHRSRTSIACRALMAEHKWALTGTPILNSLDELYSYFKFLGVPYTGNFEIFKRNYTDASDPDNLGRLLARLSQFMIRRDHSDVMFNAPILKLPRASQNTHWCEFNSVERSIYEVVRQRFAKRINFCSRSGELDKSYSNALVMLLRLRQLTAHILMLQFVVKDLLEREDIEKIREVVQREATDERSRNGQTILAIRKQLDHLEAEAKKPSTQKDTNGSRGSKRPRTFDDESDEGGLENEDSMALSQQTNGDATTGERFGKSYDFRPYLDTLTRGKSWERAKEKAKCTGCDKRPQKTWITSCGHLLCNPCYEDIVVQAAEAGNERSICRGCGSIFAYANEIPEDDTEAMVENGAPMTRSKKQQHDQQVHRIEQQDIANEWLQMGRDGVLPSAKTIALKAQILNWIGENPDVKIIIYTQFLAMIRIISRMCREEQWATEEYHGKMSQVARDKAIKHFAEDKGGMILLASLRCGGLGLNLTMASRVVILDPWWNSAAEQQAFCRVYRFGQRETTVLTRFCVKNTVDDRLIEMQQRKEKEIDSVMKDDGSKISKMGIRDLMRLFGDLRDDEKGRPFILIQNADSRGGLRADSDHEDYTDEI